jgi:hypothetical protein
MTQLSWIEVLVCGTAFLFGCGSSVPPTWDSGRDGATDVAAHDAGPQDADAAPHDAASSDVTPVLDGTVASDVPAALDVPPDETSDSRTHNDAGSSPTFAAVQAVFDARCISCHDATLKPTPVPDRPPPYPQLPLTRGASYAALVGKKAIDACAGTLVTPGDASHSYLYIVVSQDNPCTGRRMPRGGGNIRPPDPLPDAEIAIIHDWIAAGAPR